MGNPLFDKVADLALTIDSYELERLERGVAGGFTRVSTVVRLRGGGQTGLGEDVTYEAPDQDAFQEGGREPDLAGRHTLRGFSESLDGLELFPVPPTQQASRFYRRWAFESAALDLALRQAGISLATALGREPRPVRFVVSTGLGNPPSMARIHRLQAVSPGLQFKLDPTSAWDEDLIAALAATGAVTTADLKGFYHGTPVDQPPDAALYARVVDGLTEAWIEDPALTPETEPVLAPHRSRITWDAPIHSVADIEALPFPPRVLNFKPSRFGTLEALFAGYEYCATRGIGVYGGGQLELGPGRGQIQYLASLFHPDTPNDVAPAGYNDTDPSPELPVSPLKPAPGPVGFLWGKG